MLLAVPVVTGAVTALGAIGSPRPWQAAAAAGYLTFLLVAGGVVAALAATVWEDGAQEVGRTTGTVERLLRDEAVVRVDGTQVRLLAPRVPHRPSEGDRVPVTIDRAGLYTVELGRSEAELDAAIAANRTRRPPRPGDLWAALVPLAAAAATGAVTHGRAVRRSTQVAPASTRDGFVGR